VNAWASAPDAEKAARFASAEAVRWLEWGMRSYQNFVLRLAVLLFAVAVARTAWLPRPIVLDGVSGLTYLVQGWTAVKAPPSIRWRKDAVCQAPSNSFDPQSYSASWQL
jgi:hypothetical protein